MSSILNEQAAKKELALCASDFGYFARRHLPVFDRDTSRKVVFKFRPAQRKVIDSVERYPVTYVIKPRRTGISRVIMARMFWYVMFHAGASAISVLHDDDSAVEMFKQVREWYDGLPPLFQKLFPLKANKDNQLYFTHGGVYAVASARSKPVGGPTWWYRHYSEFAKYKDAEAIIRYIEAGSATHGRSIYETTGEEAGYAQVAWQAKNGWSKVFIKWTEDNGYILHDSDLAALGKTEDELLFEEVLEYAHRHGLTRGQALWLGNKLQSLGFDPQNPERAWKQFRREFPITAEEAFSSARGRVFSVHHGEVSWKPGYEEYTGPVAYTPYALGVDAAGGSEDGDFSAATMLDLSDLERPVVVASYYQRVKTPDFAEVVQDMAERYGAIVNVERSAHGMDVIQRLQESEFGNFYREMNAERVTKKLVDRIGWPTSENRRAILISLLEEFIDGQKLTYLHDKRLCGEINTFMHQENGRAEARKPDHDDALFAVALALAARPQVQRALVQALAKRPRTLEDLVHHRQRLRRDPSLAGIPFDEVNPFDRVVGGDTVRPVHEELTRGSRGRW